MKLKRTTTHSVLRQNIQLQNETLAGLVSYKNEPINKHQASCQTCAVRACVMRWRLTLARTLSLCWVRAIARVGPAARDREWLVAGRELEEWLSDSLSSSAEAPKLADRNVLDYAVGWSTWKQNVTGLSLQVSSFPVLSSSRSLCGGVEDRWEKYNSPCQTGW